MKRLNVFQYTCEEWYYGSLEDNFYHFYNLNNTYGKNEWIKEPRFPINGKHFAEDRLIKHPVILEYE